MRNRDLNDRFDFEATLLAAVWKQHDHSHFLAHRGLYAPFAKEITNIIFGAPVEAESDGVPVPVPPQAEAQAEAQAEVTEALAA